MEAQKTGLFISILRKQKGLTQSQLAERIGVTDKAVSRWERGRGFPDISLLTPLAEALGVTVTELMAGEPLCDEERAAQSDSVLIEALRYAGGMGRRTAAVLTALAGVFLLVLPIYMAGRTIEVRLAGAALLLAALIISRSRMDGLSSRWRALMERLTQRSSARIAAAVFFLLALLLELTPYGAVLRFGRPAEDGTIGFFRETYSYFGLMPVGYGNVFPFLTGILTIVLLLLSLLRLRQDSRRLGNGLFIAAAAAVVSSLMPLLLFGTEYFSAVGGLITLCLIFAAVSLTLANR